MSVWSHNTVLIDLGSIFAIGHAPGWYVKNSHDGQMSPTCRFSNPNYDLGKADVHHNAVAVLNKVRTCKTSELYQVAITVVVSPYVI